MATYIVKKFTPAPLNQKQKKQREIFSLAQTLKKINSKPSTLGEYQTLYLKDGRKIEVDKLATGGTALINDGLTTLPLENGSHRLEDGRQLIVGVGGVIASVVPKK